MIKIKLSELRKIARETITEDTLDHQGISSIVSMASKLLTALDDFEDKSTGHMKNVCQKTCAEMKKVLTDMIHNPASYLEKKDFKTGPDTVRAIPVAKK